MVRTFADVAAGEPLLRADGATALSHAKKLIPTDA